MYSNLGGGKINMLKVQEIRELIKLIDESSINEFTYETNGTTVIIKKPNDVKNVNEQETVIASNPASTVDIAPVVTEQPAEVKEEIPSVETELPVEADYDHEIISPMVGTFYQAPSPESDPYVKVGSKVTEDTVVCIVEAMKLFNEIEAEVTGEITEVLVKDGELVEYGQPLFRVKTS